MHDKTSGEDTRVVDNDQFLALVELCNLEKHFSLLIGICNKEVADEPLCVIPPRSDASCKNPTTAVAAACKKPTAATAETCYCDEPSASNLYPDQKGQATSDKEEDLPDIFDFGEEYVGVDDEHVYVPPGQPAPAEQTEHQQTDSQPAGIPSLEEVGNDDLVSDSDQEEMCVLFDPINPDIRKDALFPDMTAFRKAIRHYAIVRGVEFARIKTDPTRYIAFCAAEGCPWRIHASRLQDNRTIQVIVFSALL